MPARKIPTKKKSKWAPNAGGWKTCFRGHKYRGQVCATCWPAGAKREAAKKKARSTRKRAAK